MSAIAHLRTETRASHQRLEKRVDVKARFASRAAYLDHLVKLWGFYEALEGQLGPEVFAGALADYEARRKVPLLTRDLLALGLAPYAIDQLPRCSSVPACADTAAAFGCVYVLEGATLGGQTLLPLAESRLGLSASQGAAYLSSYGEAVTTMWQSFGSALDAWCALPERRDRAALAAIATFDSLDTWLCE